MISIIIFVASLIVAAIIICISIFWPSKKSTTHYAHYADNIEYEIAERRHKEIIDAIRHKK